MTFNDIESAGIDNFLESIRNDLLSKTYYPLKNRKHEIPKPGGKSRILSIPCIRDRVVQGAAKLILEAIFDADFQSGSYGYRPKKTAAVAIEKVTVAAIKNMTRVIDVDLKSYFDTVRHDILLSKIAERISDESIMWLLKLILKVSGKRGVPQGGPLSPLLSNIYLNEVDKMLERAKAVSHIGKTNTLFSTATQQDFLTFIAISLISYLFSLYTKSIKSYFFTFYACFTSFEQRNPLPTL